MAEPQTRDALTHMPNRQELVRALGIEFERCRRYGRPASLLVLEIEALAQIQATYGDAARDQILMDMARSLTHLLRSSDQVFRIGTDGYAVILSETADDAAQAVLKKLKDTPCAAIPNDPPRPVRIHAGLRVLGPEERSADDWFARAVDALGEAKKAAA